MKRKILIFLVIPVFMALIACQEKENVDVILFNGTIYTVDKNFTRIEAIAIRDGFIVAVGTSKDIKTRFKANKRIDLKAAPVYPGFYDPHAHFIGYAESLRMADLVGTKSFDEICERLIQHQKDHPGEWILGRGWDQNDWEIKTFPDRSKLDELFPDNPVFIKRIDGHGALANTKALEITEIDENTAISGGEIIKQDNRITGVLIDNAADLVEKMIPPIDPLTLNALILKAQDNCFEVGLTTVADCGLEKDQVAKLDELNKSRELIIRIFAMLNPSQENIEQYVLQGPYKTPQLHVNSMKLYADGALGSRGALLMQPYTDAKNKKGLQVMSSDFIREICQLCYDHNFQVETHCIGDAANHLTLSIYQDILKGKNDRRWRIEHAQIIHPKDFELFGNNSIIPSIQTSHATSDMYWAKDRIGIERIKNAYAYKRLLSENGWLPNGSDFPVEHINPLFGFFAGFARTDHSGFPEGGWQMENALSREECLRAMTIWAAKSCFEEQERGSLEIGKLADFVILDQDIMTASAMDVPKIKVLETWLNGEKVFKLN